MLKFIIDRIEDDIAVLVSGDGQTLILPKSELPRESAAGDAIFPKWSRVSAGGEESLAKQLLNDILSNTK